MKRSVTISWRGKERKKSELHSSNGDFASITHAQRDSGSKYNLVNQLKLEDGTLRSRECSVYVTSV